MTSSVTSIVSQQTSRRVVLQGLWQSVSLGGRDVRTLLRGGSTRSPGVELGHVFGATLVAVCVEPCMEGRKQG